MLLGDFFTISETKNLDNNSYKITLHLNRKHHIFEGHFPGNPIVPGVCLTQMVKEILESILKRSFNMVKADNIKFTAIVNPEITPALEAKLSLKFLVNEEIQAELSFYLGETTYYKFKGSFVSAAS